METTLLVNRSNSIGSAIDKGELHLPGHIGAEESPKQVYSRSKTFSVEIEKGAGGLGLSLAGGRESAQEFQGSY